MAEKPEWQKQEEEQIEKAKAEGKGGQIVYVSDNSFNCYPVISYVPLKQNKYPFVITAPVGMQDPKYNWYTCGWEDMSVVSQLNEVKHLKSDVTSLDARIGQLTVLVSALSMPDIIDNIKNNKNNTDTTNNTNNTDSDDTNK